MKELIIAIHAVPKSAKNEIIGWVEVENGGKALKVKVAAPPEDGKANKELIAFLAKTWGVPKSALELIAGDASRHKRLKIHNDSLSARLQSELS